MLALFIPGSMMCIAALYFHFVRAKLWLGVRKLEEQQVPAEFYQLALRTLPLPSIVDVACLAALVVWIAV